MQDSSDASISGPKTLAKERKLQNGWICRAGAFACHPGQPKRSPEDAGDGYRYKTGDFRRTTFRAETKNGKVNVTVKAAGGKRRMECPGFFVQIVAK